MLFRKNGILSNHFSFKVIFDICYNGDFNYDYIYFKI